MVMKKAGGKKEKTRGVGNGTDRKEREVVRGEEDK